MDPMHPYQLLPLFTAGLVLAAWLIGVHALMLAKPAAVQEFLKKFPRNQNIGQILLGIGLAWFWLLIAPAGLGKLSALTTLLSSPITWPCRICKICCRLNCLFRSIS